MTDATAIDVSQLFGQLYLHLHPRRAVDDYRPNRAALAVLRHLAMSGPLTVSDAGKHFGRSQAAISETFTRLIKRGLVERREDETDRRRHLVWLTANGRQLVSDESQPLDHHLVAAVLARMSPTQRENLIQGLTDFAAAAAAHATEHRKEHHHE